MRCTIVTLLCVLALALALPLTADDASDVRNARAVFEENIAAIRAKSRERYLAVYLPSDKLVRVGATGFVTGYESFAKGVGAGWPDVIEATDMHLTPIRPGLVYGTYRYRVVFGTNESSGISERLFVETPQGWKIALTGAIETPGVPPSPRALRGATLIDGKGGAPIPNANVVVREGKIECAGADCAIPDGIDVVDVRGSFITPGLIDSHVHFSQTGWADGRPDALDVRAQYPYEKTIAELKASPETFAHSYLCSGVTSVFDVGGYPWTLQLAQKFESDFSTPHIVAAGPLLATIDHWLNLPAERQFIFLKDEASGRDGVRYLASQGAKAVKVWYIHENEAALMAAGDEATKQGLPLIVHATELAGAKAAMRAGAKLLVHSVADAAIDDEFIALAREHKTILTPTLTVVDGYRRMFEGDTTIDDPNGCVDAKTRAKINSKPKIDVTPERLARLRARASNAIPAQNLKRLVDADIPIATGTDAGNPLTLHGPSMYAEMEAMQKAGMTPMQVIVASTSTASLAAGLASVTGTLEKGKDADLLVVAADPSKDVANFRKLRLVMRGGVLRTVEELHSR